MNSEQFTDVLSKAIEETHGQLASRLVGPKSDTIMATFDRQANAEDFASLVAEKTGLNAWSAKSIRGYGYVAFVNGNQPPTASATELVRHVSWLS